MRALTLKAITLFAFAAAAISCSKDMESLDTLHAGGKKQITFPVEVTRDGQKIPDGAITKGHGAEGSDGIGTMDKSRAFGLVGVDLERGALLLDNADVSFSGGQYRGLFENGIWNSPYTIFFSAYYPYVSNLVYGDDFHTYSIPFNDADTEAGPLISKTVQAAVDQLNMMPLEFQHITNDIGFKICDVTTDENLQGLIHLRKVTATNVASAGVFVNDIHAGSGFWQCRGYYRNVVVFEGDAVIGVGMENEMFIGNDALVPRMADSHRYYAIPDELEMGKQCVEVIYDVDAFTMNGYSYDKLKNLRAIYMLYGVLPDNTMAYGKQYTFHLGLDTGKLYNEITFAPSISDWETKIYENNDEF